MQAVPAGGPCPETPGRACRSSRPHEGLHPGHQRIAGLRAVDERRPELQHLRARPRQAAGPRRGRRLTRLRIARMMS